MNIPSYITLMGAEDVSKAAYSMRSAAEQMTHAGTGMSFAFESHQRFMDDWLSRFQAILENNKESQ